MPKSTSGVNEQTQLAPMAIVFPVHRGDDIFAAEEEVLPSVEEIIPHNPDAKPNF